MTATPIENCATCGDTGLRIVMRGKERVTVRCECSLRRRTERLLAAAHIPARYEHCELTKFQYDPSDAREKSIRDAHLMAWRFVEEYPIEKRGLLLVGPAGVGKTHLAIGVVKELIRQSNTQCLFYDYRELLKSIQDSYNPSSQTTEMQLLRPVLDAEVLLLDDLAAIRSSEWVFDVVNYILNGRYNADRTTLITTNFPDEPEQPKVEFDNLLSRSVAERVARGDTLGDRIGQRMWSRLHELCKKVEIEGSDYRQKKKAEFERRQGGAILSDEYKHRLKRALDGEGSQSEQLEAAILAVTEVLSGHGMGKRLSDWRPLLENRLQEIPGDRDIIAAFERLSVRGVIRLMGADGREYSPKTADDKRHFFRGLFLAQMTAAGQQFWTSKT